MKKFYFSGIDRYKFVKWLADEDACGMVVADVATQPGMIRAYADFPNVPLALDSGAFGGKMTLDKYMKVLDKVGDRFEWYANLDVIGNQVESDLNYNTLISNGYEPVWVYQVDGGAPLDYLTSMAQYFADRGKIIAIGGLVPHLKNGNLRPMIDAVAATRGTGAKIHFFGLSMHDMLIQMSPLPYFYSADSQLWLIGIKSNVILNHYSQRINAAQFKFTEEAKSKNNIRVIKEWVNAKTNQQLGF